MYTREAFKQQNEFDSTFYKEQLGDCKCVLLCKGSGADIIVL